MSDEAKRQLLWSSQSLDFIRAMRDCFERSVKDRAWQLAVDEGAELVTPGHAVRAFMEFTDALPDTIAEAIGMEPPR